MNGPIAHGDRAALVPMFFLALGLGVLEAGLIVARRACSRMAVLKIEREIRDGLYARLQRLPVEFHDRWQTGQLLSRTTTDLGTIRRFLGFGAIFIVVDGLQYLAVMALLIATYAPLGVVVLVTTLPVIWLGKRFGVGYSKISRQVQDQQGDLATLTEEAATGMRVVKAFGRGALMEERSAPRRRRCKARARHGALAGPFLGVADAHPERHDGARRPHRRHRRRPRGPLPRRPRRLHDPPRPAAVPDHRPRLDPVDGTGGRDGSRPVCEIFDADDHRRRPAVRCPRWCDRGVGLRSSMSVSRIRRAPRRCCGT